MSDLADRLWSRVEITETCWLWIGRRASNGYGRISLHDKERAVHRIAYELMVGPIPEGLHLDHLCRVRNCVNPSHLEPVTQSENNRRAHAAMGLDEHCRNGHRREGNTYIDPSGMRVCRPCQKARNQRRSTK